MNQSSDLKTSSIPIRSVSPTVNGLTEVCHLWLFCWYRSFVICIWTSIHGSVAVPVLLPIDIENSHHYWNDIRWRCRRCLPKINIFYWNTATGPKYSNDRVILCPNVETNCYDIFMRHISGAPGMLKSLRNHEADSAARRHQLLQPTRRNGGLLVRADAEKNKVSHGDYIYCNLICTSKTDRTEGKYNFGDVMGWWNSRKIK